MKFRRKAAASAEPRRAGGPGVDPGVDPGGIPGRGRTPTTDGPYDVSEVDVESSGRVDLGSLLIAPSAGREVRVQVDEATQAVQSVLVAGPDGALELRAYAAARNGDMWAEVRPQIVADIEGRGGTVEEREGRFGPELVCQRPVQMPDGKSAVQPSRIVGVNGPRWLLRATFLGAPAVRPEDAASWEDVLAQVVVRRGDHAMPPGDALPVVLPNEARKLS